MSRIPEFVYHPEFVYLEKKTLWLKTLFLVLMIFGVWQNTPRVLGFQWKCPNRLYIFPWFAAHGARWRITACAPNLCMFVFCIKMSKSVEANQKSVDAFCFYSSRKWEVFVCKTSVLQHAINEPSSASPRNVPLSCHSPAAALPYCILRYRQANGAHNPLRERERGRARARV